MSKDFLSDEEMAKKEKEFISDEEMAALEAPAPEKQPPGMMESLTRGGLQGASFGFSDEAIALLSALKNIAMEDNKTLDEIVPEYVAEVAKQRESEKAAQGEHPALYMAGEVAGSVANPSLNLGNRVASLMAQAGIEGYGRAEGDIIDQGEQALTAGATAPALAAATETLVPGMAKLGGKILNKGWQLTPDLGVTRAVGEYASDVTGGIKDKLKFIFNESMQRGKKLHAPESIKDAQERVFQLPKKIHQSINDATDILYGDKVAALKQLDKAGKIDANEITGITDDIWQAITPNKSQLGPVRADFQEAYAQKGTGTLADLIEKLDGLKAYHPDKIGELNSAKRELEQFYHNTLFGSPENYSKFKNAANKNQIAYMDKYAKNAKKVLDGKMMKSELNAWEKQELMSLETKQGLLLDKSIKKLKPSEVDNIKRELGQTQSFKMIKQFGADAPKMKGKDYGFTDINQTMNKMNDSFDNKLQEIAAPAGIDLQGMNKEISSLITAKDLLDKSGKNLVGSDNYDVSRNMQNVFNYKKMLEDTGLGDLSSHIDESVNEIMPLHEAMQIVGKNQYAPGASQPNMGAAFLGKTAGNLGQEMAHGGSINRSIKSIKDNKDRIYANLAAYSPDVARGFNAAAESGDDKKLGMTVSSILGNVPGARDFVQPSPLKTSDGREILSLFDDTIHDPNEVQVIRDDIMKRNDLSNSDKATMVDSLNKSGKIMNLPKKKDVEMEPINIKGYY